MESKRIHIRSLNPVEEAELNQMYIAQSHEPARNSEGGETWVYVRVSSWGRVGFCSILLPTRVP